MGVLRFLKRYSYFARRCKAATGRSHVALALDLAKMVKRGFYSSEYYTMALYERVPGDYIGMREGIEVEKTLNPRMTGVVNFDKWQQSCFFKANGISTPYVHGFVSGRRVLIGRLTYDIGEPALLEVLSRLPTPFAVKPYGGGHGAGFDIVEKIYVGDGSIGFRGRGLIDFRSWAERVSQDAEGLLLQELLQPHSALRAFGDTALNTLRIVTVRGRDGVPKVAAMLFKLARVGSLVDNIGAGALAAHVDITSGRLSKAFTWPEDGVWETHPDTGMEIEGYELPYWEEAKSLVLNAHERLTSGGSLSWDVAITDYGAVVLEMNAFTPRPVYQRLGRGLLSTAYGDVLRERKDLD